MSICIVATYLESIDNKIYTAQANYQTCVSCAWTSISKMIGIGGAEHEVGKLFQFFPNHGPFHQAFNLK
jgi:hypothetical protein